MPALLLQPDSSEVIDTIRIRNYTRTRPSAEKKRQESSVPLQGTTGPPAAPAISASASSLPSPDSSPTTPQLSLPSSSFLSPDSSDLSTATVSPGVSAISSSASSLPSPDSSPTTPQLPLPSSSFLSPDLSSSPSPSAATVSPTPSSTSTDQLGSDGLRATKQSTVDTTAIIFGVIGGILGLILLGLIAFRLLRQHRRNSKKQVLYESFWENWHWGTYSPVEGDVVFSNHDVNIGDNGANEDPKARSGERLSTWWEKVTSVIVSGVANRGKKNKKPRTGELYKVRSLKPGEKFEIDSFASWEIVDLTAGTSSR